MTFPASGPVTLRTNLADYPVTRALKAGEIESDLVRFDFCGPKSAFEGFKPMVREGRFEAGELAIVTFLQAKTYGKPLVLLPAVVMGRFQHHCIGYNAERGEVSPAGIAGKRIGVRSYTQTTGAWVRGILAHEYGVDLSDITTVTTEGAHLAEFPDPPGVERTEQKLDQMLLAGEIDALVAGDLPRDPRIKPVIPDPEAAARAWYRKHGTVPINHLFVVHAELARTRPDVVAEIYRLLLAGKRAAPPPADGIDFHPFGVEALRRPLALIIQYAFEQRIIPRRFEVDELFDATTRALAT